ncbi:NADH-quinone oxidoreductase subunit C/D [Bacteroidia bacterium]|nr:NADH-quinone oxidoreductase subunit C/D [Bacteroidia bacterium]GHT47920.1 NADH-quinone oxidoreductase subunit C/D [Bacteroidia bacterium]
MKVIDELLSKLPFATTGLKDKTYTVSVPKENLYEAASFLKKNDKLSFDFLMDVVGMDYGDNLGVIYYLSATQYPSYIIALKTATDDREDPQIDSISDLWESAGLYEREVHDFFGIRFVNNQDMRRLFLRQDWNGYPLRKDYDTNPELNPIPLCNEDLNDMENMPVIEMVVGEKQDNVHKLFDAEEYIVNFGPQHPATHGVLHLRVSLEGEMIKKVDPNFGYIHRGIEKMSEAYTYPQILHLTDRLDYLSGTINRHGTCLAVEKGLELDVPERAHYIRTIIDELTRVASHLLGWGCMAMDMGSITAFVYGMRDREKIMDIFEETCGGRLMANYSVIGGVMNDIHPNFQKRVKEFIPYMRKMLKEHHLLFTGNPIARDRMEGVGYLSKEQAISLGATGPTGRASGWSNDVRKIEPYAAYRHADFKEVLRSDGLTFDRYIIRLDEIEESLKIIEQLIDNIPGGAYAAKTKAIIKLPEGEFHQRVEGARGEFDVYINSKGDKSPYRIKFRSPCMTLVNTLKSIAVGTKVADLIMLGGSLDYVVPCIDR